MSNRAKATRTTIEDGEPVTITEWRFAPGAETGWHQHGLDYVIMYRTAAHLAVATRDGVVSVDIAEGTTYFRQAGAEHNIINAGSNEVVFLEGLNIE
jgi:quercetin dioxygenase-like cupin family protein